MAVSNMKYKKASSSLYQMISNMWPVILGLVGISIGGIIPGGIVGAVIGFCVTAVMQATEARVASGLEWSDIELAVRNYVGCYRPGIGKIEFRVMGKKFFFSKPTILHISEGDHFAVWYKTERWRGILDETDDEYFSCICGKEPIRTAKWDQNKTFLVLQQEDTNEVVEKCLKLIKHLIEKSGGTVADVKAIEDIGSIWVSANDQSISPVPFVKFNFKGKKDGRPVLTLTDRKGYWILQEDGELEPFTDFDGWYNTPVTV